MTVMWKIEICLYNALNREMSAKKYVESASDSLCLYSSGGGGGRWPVGGGGGIKPCNDSNVIWKVEGGGTNVCDSYAGYGNLCYLNIMHQDVVCAVIIPWKW